MSRTWSGVTTPGAGSTDRVVVGQHTAINNLTDLTVCVWNFRTGVGGSSLGRLAQKGIGAGQSEWQWFHNGVTGTTTDFQATRWNTTTGTWQGSFTYGGSIWEHAALTYSFSSTANNPLMYKNGVSQSVARTTAPAGTLATTTTADLGIGNDPTGVRCWAGRLMHFAVWNRILTAGEIMGVYRYGPLHHASGLVTYLPLWGTDSPEPNHAPQGGATRNGTVTGTTTGAANDIKSVHLLGAA